MIAAAFVVGLALGAAEPVTPAPDAKSERTDIGVAVPIAQLCAGTAIAWLPIPCVTSAASGYVITAGGNALSARDAAAIGPMLAAVIADLSSLALIAGSYGLIFVALSSGNEALAVGGGLGGIAVIFGAMLVRPFAIALAETITWGVLAEPGSKEPWLPPPLFAPEDGDAQ